ncbi:site-specific integrase [Rhodococcus sp. 05-340-1]|uniref:tyrosine-type recombinase/integrase n=1 Tax=unclassified Rhodococcus (in: high G+C Gram-positive bacteria) TaxID=192944 RepID=UPI000B9A2E52|nr:MULTISPECIES: site-specific integrase [unclassified Rhodococcus (in: high G+C Gram-positive bacteria)]OZD66694.1 site-specific integrase [Rhodococcus sp. 05-340-2]OZD80770.1 site-specific integrase [Rhodococcus sp. 05-340-1]
MARKPKRTRRAFGQLRQLPSGRWQAGYTGPDGLTTHRAPTTFDAKDYAEGWLATERKKIELGTWTPPREAAKQKAVRAATFADYAASWLEHRSIRPRTRENYRYLLDSLILPVLGGLVLTEITTADVRAWHHGLGTQFATRNARAYGVVTAVFNSAVDDELLDRSPARIKGAGQVKHRREIDVLTPAELVRLADAMPDELKLSVLLSAWCGLRRGETFELRRKDLLANNAVLSITRGVTYRDREFVVGPPKTKESIRKVTIPPHLRPEIERHLTEHVGPGRDDLLFPDPTGGHMREWTYRRQFDAAKAKLGRDDLHVHDLRHFGGVMAAHTGATTKEVMDRLGHVTSSAAMRYQHTASGRAELVADKLSALAAQ